MVVNPPDTRYALLVKWLTHLTFYQTFKGSSPLQGTKRNGRIAQLAEHKTENLGVGGSIPPLTTIMWVSFKGRTSAFQADNVGSIPSTHSKLNYIGFNFDAET